MSDARTAPKRWCLSENETLNTFETWRQNQLYNLTLEKHFVPFLAADFKWTKQSTANPTRGLVDDGAGVAEAKRKTAKEKLTYLDLMLNQLANYIPILSRNSITRDSTSLAYVWNAIRLHFGFAQTGAQFLNFAGIRLEPEERPETLYQRILAFVEDSLLMKDGNIKHHGEKVSEDELMTPTLENMVVMHWLSLINKDLPELIMRRYATELRTHTLASIKPEISMALKSLLDDLQTSADARVLRTAITGSQNTFNTGIQNKFKSSNSKYNRNTYDKPSDKSCSLCEALGVPHNHQLSRCSRLSEKDKKFMARLRALNLIDTESDIDEHDDLNGEASIKMIDVRRVSIVQSPILEVSYNTITISMIIDSGATGNFIHINLVAKLGLKMSHTNHNANQADGRAKMNVLGEVKCFLNKGKHKLFFDGLVVSALDAEIIGGSPFQELNDVFARPSKKYVQIGDEKFPYSHDNNDKISSRRMQAHVVSLRRTTTVWPNEDLDIDLPDHMQSEDVVAVEPRSDNCKSSTFSSMWPQPNIVSASNGKIHVHNHTKTPIVIHKNSQFCQILAVSTIDDRVKTYDHHSNGSTFHNSIESKSTQLHSSHVQLDPNNTMPQELKTKFQDQLEKYDSVFSSQLPGYNGAFGPIKAKVNMGPVQPPQRKGRLPLYGRNNLEELQSKFDELEALGVFCKPEDINVSVEYLNPSFLVKKPGKSGKRLVTAFSDIGRYSKPQPTLLPDINSVLRTIGQWNHIVAADLTKAYFQVPLDRDSMKYCGVCTPFKGTRVYARSAMGMPGSEVALEELLCRVLGELIEEGFVCKIADNLFCGGQNLDELYSNWERVLCALEKADLKLSAVQTIINPSSTTILGWVWSKGSISASPHQILSLSNCSRPETVKQLRSFVGAYKILARVIKHCASFLACFDDMTAGKNSSDKLLWTEDQIESFNRAQSVLSDNKSIVLPKASDQLWIVTDGAVRKPGIASTLYVTRNEKPLIAGFFSAKLRKNQLDWLPCEVEALCISASLQYFSSFIIQSHHKSCVVTDSKPCCQSYEKLCRGEFSTSPKVSTFLSTVSRYQASVRHIKGVKNGLSDFGSRNPCTCEDQNCQICIFIAQSEECVVRNINVQDILDNRCKLPFTNRSAWAAIQLECSDLRRVHSHLKQGTRPSKKVTNALDVKRYLQNTLIARDGILVVKSNDLYSVRERIVVPRSVINGLLTALHLRLNHPKIGQLKAVCNRYFFALDMDKCIDITTKTCHPCESMKEMPHTLIEQSTSDPPAVVGSQFAADVINRERQSILVVREYVTSFTSTTILPNEQHQSLREGLIVSTLNLRPMDGPFAVIRTDPAPGFQALQKDDLLEKCRLSVEVGRKKNVNKNPVAERAVQEVEEELLKLDPRGSAVSQSMLAIATSNLNAKLRSRGLSAREMLYQRDQFSNAQISMSDEDLIQLQHEAKVKNHKYSEISKAPTQKISPESSAKIGDLVYVKCDKSKGKARERYLVVSEEGDWLSIRKFTNTQLRTFAYRVKRSEVYTVPFPPDKPLKSKLDDDCEEVDQISREVDDVISKNASDILPTDALRNGNDSTSDNIKQPTRSDTVQAEPPSSPAIPDLTYMPEEKEYRDNYYPEPPSLPAIPNEIDMPDDSNDSQATLHEPIGNTRPKRTVKAPDRLTIEW